MRGRGKETLSKGSLSPPPILFLQPDPADGLDRNLGRNLLVRNNGQAVMLALDKPAHIPPDVHGSHEYRLLRVGRILPGGLGYGAQEPLRRIGIERKECAAEVCRMALRIVSSTEGSSRIAGSMFCPFEYM